MDDYQGLFEQRRAVHNGDRWEVVIFRPRARLSDGVPVWVRVGVEPLRYRFVRRLLSERPDVRRGSLHHQPVFGGWSNGDQYRRREPFVDPPWWLYAAVA